MAGEVIAKMLMEAKNNLPKGASDLIFGKVVKAKPLEILVDERYTLTSDMLVLLSPVKEKKVSFNVSDQIGYSTGGISYVTNSTFGKEGTATNKGSSNFVTSVSGGSRTITLTIFEALKVGEKVAMIKGQNNQIYYVLDRV